ncbi:uncharacterized protein [Nicotiana tomentosiformis]|uniref:uncharacterized protein n=1 Tax=Nicotiana tomentosiformis TaxID=4098 RepID=UPI00388C7D45
MSSDAIGTAANSTKALTSGKVVGKPTTNHAKQEWMQARKNKYQRDNRGHIVDNKQGKEADKGKGKAKVEEVATKNKFNTLEVEEVHQLTLQITEGKGEDHNNGKKKEHGEKQAKKGQEKEMKVDTQEEHKRVKKEAVEKVVENEHNGNPIPSGIQSSAPKDGQELDKDNSSVPSAQRTDEIANKEPTIDWIEDLDEVNSTKVLWSDAVEVKDDQLGTTKTTEVKVKKDNKSSSPGDRLATPGLKPGSSGVRLATLGLKPGSPGIRIEMLGLNPSSPGIRMVMPGLKPGSPGVRLATPGLKPGSPDEATIVNPNHSATGEILAYVDSVPVYALEKKLDGYVNVNIRDDILGSDQISGNGKGGAFRADCHSNSWARQCL